MASNIAHSSPILADPANPTDPAICAAISERISPYRFSVTMTSKISGYLPFCCTNIDNQCSFSISGYSKAISSKLGETIRQFAS
jgi:hypothetical protein